MNRASALKPYSSLPEPFVLMAIVAWVSLLAASWEMVRDDGLILRAIVYGVLLAGAAAHTWFFALRALWSNASHVVSITALWLVVLVAAVTWLHWGADKASFGLVAFVLIAQCSFLFNHGTLRLAHAVSFIVLLAASAGLPLVGGGAAWLAFALLSMFILAYDRTARKAGPTGYDNGESRRTGQRLALVSIVALVTSLLFFVTPLIRWPDIPSVRRPAPDPNRQAPSEDDPFGISGSTQAPNLSNARLEVMQVAIEPAVSGPLYLRGQSFDTFDGREWSNSRNDNRAVTVRGSAWTDLGFPPLQVTAKQSKPFIQTVEMKVRMADVLFTAARPRMVQFPAGDRKQVTVGSSDRSIRISGSLPAGARYRVDASQDVFSDASPLNVSYSSRPDYEPADQYVPDHVDPDVKELARTVTAGKATPYQRALALERYLQSHYYYSLTHDVDGREVVNEFLLGGAKRGHCALFASSMVMMARSVGLPARYVTGFLTDDQRRRGVFAVQGSDAHAWVEVYVHGAGWIAFDPTSGRVAPSDARTSQQVAASNDVRVTAPSERGGGLYGRDGDDFGQGGEPAPPGDEIASNEPPEEDPNGAPVPGDDGEAGQGDTGGGAGATDGGQQPGERPGGAGATVTPPGGDTTLPRGGEQGQQNGQQGGGQQAEPPNGNQGSGGGQEGPQVDRGSRQSDVRPPSVGERAPAPKRPDPPPPDPAQVESDWRTLVIGLLILGIAGLALLLVWQRGVRRVVEQREIRRALPLTVDDDPDARRLIVKLYHAMVDGLGRVGFPKREGQTPLEYATAVGGREQKLSEPVGELTELFHLARYDDRPVTRDDAMTARGAWRRIATSVKRVSRDNA